MSLAGLWPALIVTLASGVIVATLHGQVPHLYGATYHLRDGTDAWYYELGGNDGLVFLRSCGRDGSVVEIRRSDILRIEYEHDTLPQLSGPRLVSAWQLLHGVRASVGLRFPCPTS